MYKIQVYDAAGQLVDRKDMRLAVRGIEPFPEYVTQPKAVEGLTQLGLMMHPYEFFNGWRVELVKVVVHAHTPEEIVKHRESVPGIRPTQGRYGS